MKTNENPVDLRAVAGFLWRIRWFLIAGFILGAAAGVTIVIMSRPLYESQALLAPAKGHQSLGGIAGLLGQAEGLGSLLDIPSLGASDTAETVAVLRSRSFRLRFIERHDVLQFLYPGRWDSKQRRWRVTAGPPPEDILQKFDKWRTVEIDRRSGMVVIAMRGPTPALVKEWVQATIDEVNADLRANTLALSGRAVALIRERLEKETVTDVRASLSSLLEIELKNEVAALTRPDFALRVLDAPSLPGKQVYPRPVRMTIAGAFVGTLAALIFCAIFSSIRRQRSTRANATVK